MSEHDEQRPLTRRELRLREMGETGALDLTEVAEPQAESGDSAPEETPAPAPVSEEIEISPFNEDGTPRSRREMRQLREEALAAREAAAEPEPEPAAEETPAEDAPADEAPVEDAPVEDAPAAPLTGEMDFDSLISPPTEPFTVEELREAERAAEAEAEAPAAEPEPEPEPVVEADPAVADDADDAAPKAKRRFPWQRRGADEPAAMADAETEQAEAEQAADAADAAPDAPVADPEQMVDDAAPTVAVPVDAVLADPAPSEAVEDLPAAPADEAPAEDAPAEPAEEKPSYSFPDIAPPEEWRSVFDDPATRSMPAQGGDAQGGFDDLISRAVSQEGAGGTSNTSALILPSMPEETTGGLTGPLGGTGDLYVTGSLQLPKSLGETGGHSSLHDSIEIDPITGAESGDPQVTGQGPAPVSARHAVSARVDSTIPVVAKPAKERSKLPLVLSLTGGGLLLAVVALGIWGASNGMFG